MAKKIYKLCISYDEKGAEIRRKMMKAMTGVVFDATLRNLEEAVLPPGDGLILVYPAFMQTGRTVTGTLPARLKAIYAARGENPEIVLKPVPGADSTLACSVLPVIRKDWPPDSALLVVAHGVNGMAPPPEPMKFLQMVSETAPEIEETALCYFGSEPTAEQVLKGLKSVNVVVLPFLIGEGKHLREDMPTAELAAKYGKTLKMLPPLGKLYVDALKDN